MAEAERPVRDRAGMGGGAMRLAGGQDRPGMDS